jgi:hypothetical protein
MANNPTRIGQANLAGDARALFLKVFAGEVLAAFAETNVFLAKTMTRTIASGRTAQFPAAWKGTAGYHTPGARLAGSLVAANEITIEIDDLLVADRFLANIDEAMNHYDFRSVLSQEMGQTLSRQMDTNIARVMINAARAGAAVTGGNGGAQIVSTTAGTDITAFRDAIFLAAQRLDEKDVTGPRCLFIRPSEYNWLVAAGNGTFIDTDVNPEGNGSVASGVIKRIAGIEIVKTNNLPRTNFTASPYAKYNGDFSKTLAVIATPMAVGTVKLLDLAMESEYQIERQGELMVGKYAVGHGILRSDCAVEINIGAGTFRP